METLEAMAAVAIAPSSLKTAARFSCSLLLLLLLSLGGLSRTAVVSADELLTSNFAGVTFGRSFREPKYKIEFHSVTSPFKPDDGHESIAMSNKEGHKFMCFLPLVEETKTVKSFPQQNSTSIILDTDRRIKLKTPDELLDVLKDKCFYRYEGWWSYEFCHLKHLRQLHLEDDKVVQEFYMGVFDPEATSAFNQNHSDDSMLKDPRSKDASQRYHPHQYTNGTICDLTNQPRETELRFVCSESAVAMSSIKEISTCKYVVTVQCPTLCKHPIFQQERPTWYTIHCNELQGDTKDSSSVEDEEDSAKATLVNVITGDYQRYAT